MTESSVLRYKKLHCGPRQTLGQDPCHSLHLFHENHSAYGFLKLAHRIIFNSSTHFPQFAVFCELYLPYCPFAFQEISDPGAHKADYRNDVKLQGYRVRPQNINYMIRDELYASFCSPLKIDRSQLKCGPLSIPSILSRCRKYWTSLYLLSPKNVLHLLVYTLLAYRTPSLICQSPAASNCAGNLNSFNYNTLAGA